MPLRALTQSTPTLTPRRLLGTTACLMAVLSVVACDPETTPKKDTSAAEVSEDIVENADGDASDSPDTDTPQSQLAPSIHGTHRFRVGNQTFAGAYDKRTIRSEDDAASEHTATTSIFGDWLVPAGVKPGKYFVCTSGPELPEYCHPEPITVPPAVSPEGVRTRQIKAGTFEHPVTSPAIFGRVALADKSVCSWRFPLHDVEVDGAVQVDLDGKTYTAKVNHEGIFLLPLPAGARGKTVTLKGTCGASTASVTVVVGESPVEANVTLSNRPPRPVAILLTEEGKPVRALKWGHTYLLLSHPDHP